MNVTERIFWYCVTDEFIVFKIILFVNVLSYCLAN
jgi:hypothetical protein